LKCLINSTVHFPIVITDRLECPQNAEGVSTLHIHWNALALKCGWTRLVADSCNLTTDYVILTHVTTLSWFQIQKLDWTGATGLVMSSIIIWFLTKLCSECTVYILSGMCLCAPCLCDSFIVDDKFFVWLQKYTNYYVAYIMERKQQWPFFWQQTIDSVTLHVGIYRSVGAVADTLHSWRCLKKEEAEWSAMFGFWATAWEIIVC
jgi:hypothetical protein